MHRTNGLLLLIALCVPAATTAQVPWESPHLLGPGAPAGVSLMFVDYGLDPHSGLGGALIWRTHAAPAGIGLRASAAKGRGDKLNFAGGIDVTAPLMQASAQFPLELMWTSGLGASCGEYIDVSIPMAIAGGRAVATERLWFNPYTSARAVIEGRFGEEAPEDELGIALAIDVGADIAFGRARNFAVRMAASLGDRHALAIGMHWGGGRPPISAVVTPAMR